MTFFFFFFWTVEVECFLFFKFFSLSPPPLQVDPTMKLPNPILLSTLFRLSRVVRELWNDELKEDNIARVHQNIFYLENFNYFGIHRLGGTFSELRSRHADDIKSKLGGRIFNSQNNTDTQLVTITSQNHSDNGSGEFISFFFFYV